MSQRWISDALNANSDWETMASMAKKRGYTSFDSPFTAQIMYNLALKTWGKLQPVIKRPTPRAQTEQELLRQYRMALINLVESLFPKANP